MTSLAAPPPARSPWQRLYAAAHAARRRHWAPRALALPRPAISVGNLHWGGSGKTPLVAALAAWLRDRDLAVAVLSRGYRRRGRAPLIASRGAGALAPPEEIGDEPALLAALLPGVAVVVGADRLAAGRLALAALEPPPQLFVLDDAFSHLRLARDLDLLALPADDPWGGGRLCPSGRLREPLAAARHASAVVLTGVEATPELARAVGDLLRAHGFAGPAVAAPAVTGAPRRADGELLPAGERVLLVAGIARPARFFGAAARSGVTVAGTLAFADHHGYPYASLRRIERAASAAGAGAVLTTAKDLVKLRTRLDLPLAELPIRAAPEPALFAWLGERLAEVRR